MPSKDIRKYEISSEDLRGLFTEVWVYLTQPELTAMSDDVKMDFYVEDPKRAQILKRIEALKQFMNKVQ